MPKKLCVCFILFFLLTSLSLYAQSAVPVLPEHEKTARRYASLAVQAYVADAIDSAISYAEMALDYDYRCSDALYVRGLCAHSQQAPRNTVLPYFEKALNFDTFSAYSADAVRLTLAGEYAAQKRYGETLSLLDRSPKLLTADAQYLRGICLYGSGNLQDARTLISSTWRIYPRDARFPKLFFCSETPCMTNGVPGFDPEAAAMGSKLLQNLKNWGDIDPELYLYAASFVPVQEALKLLKQYTSWVPMKNRAPFYAAQGLRNTYLTPDEAIERFELLCASSIQYSELETFVAVLAADSSPEALSARSAFKNWLSQYSGTIFLNDAEKNSVTVQYKNGRPFMAACDIFNDDVIDWRCLFDYGIPRQFIDTDADTTVVYARYPWVSSVSSSNLTWDLLPDAVAWPSIDVEPCPFISDDGSVEKDFYVPIISYTGSLPDESLLRPQAWKVTLYDDQTGDQKLEYALFDGAILSCTAVTSWNDRTVTRFTDSIPKIREYDLSSDGSVDVVEFFEISDNPSESDMILTHQLYGPFTPDAAVRTARIEISSQELELEGFEYSIDEMGTEILTWDTQIDGTFSQKVIRPSDNSSFTFTTVDPLQDEIITVTVFTDHQVAVEFNGIPISVAYDDENDFYWIGEDNSKIEALKNTAFDLREEVLQKAGAKPAITITKTIDGVQYTVSKNSSWIFGTRRINQDIKLN